MPGVPGPLAAILRPGLEPIRRKAQTVLLTKVNGDDFTATHRHLWDAPGEREFTETDPIWRVHGDASMFVGGIRALLLQSLHPLAMAAVSQHSGYRSDPWGRLQRTSHFIAATTYSSTEVAAREIGIVRRVHEHITGHAADGRAYAASDPHLLMWVHVAEIDSFLAAHQAFGRGRLSASEADLYVAQAGRAAAALGVIDPPQTYAELSATIERYRPELAATQDAAEAAHILLAEPPIPLVIRPGYLSIAAGAIRLLPAWARDLLDLGALDRLPAPVAGIAGRVSTGLIRWMLFDADELNRY